MQYKFVTERLNYDCYASGKVFYSFPGLAAFPVRLASEIFLQCRDIAKWEGQVGSLQQQQSELAAYFQEPASKEILDRAAFLNSQIDARSFPWTKIFMDLEPTLPAGVRVINIAPKLVGGRVEVDLTIGAGSDEQKLKFIESLEKSHAFSNIRLKDDRHSDQPGNDRVQLQLSAVYATT